MDKLSHHQKKILKIVSIIALAVLSLLAIVWFVLSLRQSITSGDLQTDGSIIRKHHQEEEAGIIPPPSAITIESIRPWMTFNYLNVVFKLPPSFLKAALAITDARYPNIRIDSYTRMHSIDEAAFMKAVQQAITSYAEPK